MSGRFLLDTNIVIAIFNGEPAIKDKLSKANEIFISITVLGELFFGAYKSKRSKNNLKRITEFADSVAVLSCNNDTAQQYGIVKNQLQKNGTLIPENDIWIAAVALQYDLILVTRDGHFDVIEKLECEKW